MLSETIVIDQDLAFKILEVLRLDPIYILLHTEYVDELGDDFKPHKWEGYELEHAKIAGDAYRALLATMTDQV